MGCWGFGIMESDDALDFECDFLDIAGVTEASPATRTAIETHLEALLARARNEPVLENYTQFRAVAFQTLAVLVMRAGCTLTAEQRDALVRGSQDCYEYQLAKTMQGEAAGRRIDAADLRRHDLEPEYGSHEGVIERLYGRIDAIESLVQYLQAYPLAGGEPTEVPSRGLFEVFADAQQKRLAAQQA